MGIHALIGLLHQTHSDDQLIFQIGIKQKSYQIFCDVRHFFADLIKEKTARNPNY
ncbi:hypothetical protein VA7868_00574 [Vibrio aerogenes CECT 7868]|uniref:Uncharacterized protein n=1 Tax=Vibrio aerogenes CECT 7868 TaxID=1216006 RepID=A0A1M5W0K2_9VIBR|nr:hypothetical protein VA7868_00574 [Vibrio aerogenes CECT 7868]